MIRNGIAFLVGAALVVAVVAYILMSRRRTREALQEEMRDELRGDFREFFGANGNMGMGSGS